jgi:predicted RNA-binding protein YlxR (DUF448 family)
MRRKHVPQRTCVGCGETRSKRELTRIVRMPDGTVDIDPTGKKPGRGAYLCKQVRCWQQALAKGAISRALGVVLPDDVKARLQDQLHLLQLEGSLSGDEEPEP